MNATKTDYTQTYPPQNNGINADETNAKNPMPKTQCQKYYAKLYFQNRQMSASTSCLPEMNQPRPKSSFDLVRHAREKEAAQPPQREIFSRA